MRLIKTQRAVSQLSIDAFYFAMRSCKLGLGPSKRCSVSSISVLPKVEKKTGGAADEAKELFYMEESAVIGEAAARSELGR